MPKPLSFKKFLDLTVWRMIDGILSLVGSGNARDQLPHASGYNGILHDDDVLRRAMEGQTGLDLSHVDGPTLRAKFIAQQGGNRVQVVDCTVPEQPVPTAWIVAHEGYFRRGSKDAPVAYDADPSAFGDFDPAPEPEPEKPKLKKKTARK